MKARQFEIKFRNHPECDRLVEATSHAKAKMKLAYELVEAGVFNTFGEALLAIATCRVLQPMKRGKPEGWYRVNPKRKTTRNKKAVIDKTRLEIANKVLAVLGESYRKTEFVVSDRNRLYLNWFDYYGKAYSRPWATRGGSAYPSWSDKLSCGGTMMTAIAQLALWVRGLPCCPIQTWEYWCGETVRMDGGETIIPLLEDSDYPKSRECAFCGATNTRLDWYWFSPHPKHSGFGCQRPECQPIKDLRNSLIDKQQNRVKRILSSQRIPASVK